MESPALREVQLRYRAAHNHAMRRRIAVEFAQLALQTRGRIGVLEVPEMPERLRTFVESEWELDAEDLEDAAFEATSEQAAFWRRVFRWRRYRAARWAWLMEPPRGREWMRTHGISALEMFGGSFPPGERPGGDGFEIH